MANLDHLTMEDRKLIKELVRQLQVGEWSGSIQDIAEKFEITRFDVMGISADLLYRGEIDAPYRRATRKS